MPARQTKKLLRFKPPGPDAPAIFDIPTHDPPLTPRDEVVFLLHTGAEIEHALLVQYLYAAYSLKSAQDVPQEHAAKVRAWKKTLLEIAREEMGHLITVQNLLRLVGGPLNLEREDYPFRTQLYPFHFRLEPLSKASLAKYVVAEMPYEVDPADEIKEIVAQATGAATMQVNQVGAIYARVMQLLSVPGADGGLHLNDEDFMSGVSSHQARYGAWGGADSVLVPDIANRTDALWALSELAEQGEGLEDSATLPSHYQRFLTIYREFPTAGDWEPVHRVPIDPETGPTEGVIDDIVDGLISHPRSLKWARLFNLRYRMLLAYLLHFLQSKGSLINEDADRTPRGLLNQWTFDEMRHMSQIASKLAVLPRVQSDPELPDRAGAPFELPYTLNLSDREQDRWRTHLDLLDTCLGIERSIATEHAEDASEGLIGKMMNRDLEAQRLARLAMRGEPLAYEAVNFRKVIELLESSVRGFNIGAHHNFWRGCTRDQFVAMSVFGEKLIAVRPDGTFDAANSILMKALRGEPPFDAPESGEHNTSSYPRMPAHHPPIPSESIVYIANWIDNGCADSEPAGQVAIPEA